MIEERVLTPGELEIKQKAQTTGFPDLYYDCCDDPFNMSVPPIGEWEKVLVGKRLLKKNEEECENVRNICASI